LIGLKLLHYDITAKLGEGGMGEVYRATDSKLGREVAIKVLPAAFVEDPERLARFEREARVLAALEHPNIAGIYGLEEVDAGAGFHLRPDVDPDSEEGRARRPAPTSGEPESTLRFLVMQLAPGEDLSKRLNRAPMSIEEALPIALQIAEALEAAHDRGIVHRDLKPANIMLAADGAVKVLDFGLAKAWDDGAGTDPNITASPTLTAQMTQAGVILGTAGYMSPEQARGQEADRRSDIWSFGVVLHEMLTGKRLFQADTVSDTLARVLEAEPEWDEIDAGFPLPITALLRRCLERDMSRRLQAIGEARIAIENHLADPEAVSATSLPAVQPDASQQSSRWLRVLPWVVGGLAAGWILSLVLSAPGEETVQAETLRFSIRPPSDSVIVTEDVGGLDISRDGRKIAFVASPPGSVASMLYLKTATDAEARPIPDTEEARNPIFSPDGEWIAYFTDREFRKINLLGGRPITLAATQDRRGAVWNTDGFIYFVPQSNGPVVRISEAGGEVEPATRIDGERRERTHRWPALLPDGKGILFTADTFDSTEYYDDANIDVLDLETGERKTVLEGSSRAAWLPPGHLLFARDGSLYAVPFDLKTREVTGSPELALQGVSTIVASGAVQFALSAEGSLAYIPGDTTLDVFDLTWLGPGDAVETIGSEVGQYFQAAVSPDGSRVALGSAAQGSRNLWIYDLDREVLNRLTFEGTNANPIWTHDGQRVVFSSDRDGDLERPYWKSADGSGEAELLWDAPRSAVPVSISEDGRTLLAVVRPPSTASVEGRSLWVVDLTGEREPYEFLADTVAGEYADLSPDGRFVAYSSRESGFGHIYVKPFPEGAGKWQVSNVNSREPRWSPDGKRLYYRSNDGLQYVEVDLTSGFRAGRPQIFWRAPLGAPFNLTYSFAPDGQRVLVLTPHLSRENHWVIHVVLNWRSELERMLAPSR